MYAQKDEMVTCENEHDVCFFTQDVHFGDVMDLENQLQYVKGQQMPAMGTSVDVCFCICGARYVGGRYSDPGVFHFKDGWRGH